MTLVDESATTSWQGDTDALVTGLRNAAGSRNVLTSAGTTERFRKSYRGALGEAVAVVLPNTLLEL
jgi:hypothetical protein